VSAGFNSITTDNAASYATKLAALGKRNISRMQGGSVPPPPGDPLPPPTVGQTTTGKPDPSVITANNGGSVSYFSVEEVNDNGVAVRQSPSLKGLGDAGLVVIWQDPSFKAVWAPEIMRIGGRYYVYFAADTAVRHRMFVTSSSSPTTGYSTPSKMALPDDKWAIDGTTFLFNNQRYFVWSGWAGDANGKQNLYLAKMTSPTTVTEPRIIQPCGGNVVMTTALKGRLARSVDKVIKELAKKDVPYKDLPILVIHPRPNFLRQLVAHHAGRVTVRLAPWAEGTPPWAEEPTSSKKSAGRKTDNRKI
jgi:hypothetical protein